LTEVAAAILAAVEGVLPAARKKHLPWLPLRRFPTTAAQVKVFPPGWKPGSTSAKLAGATVFKQTSNHLGKIRA